MFGAVRCHGRVLRAGCDGDEHRGRSARMWLRRGLADALDMLTVCVEAGQGFDGAILHVARAVDVPLAGSSPGSLPRFRSASPAPPPFPRSRRARKSRDRTFVTALVQADRLGLPIGSVLREQSVQMRMIRRQRAEEKAQKVPIKICSRCCCASSPPCSSSSSARAPSG